MNSSKRFENILNLDAKERYLFTINTICDSEEIWCLDNGGMVSHVDQFNHISIPFWPEKEFAKYSAKNEWCDSEVISMDIDYFLYEAIPYIISIKANILVFPMLDIEKNSIAEPRVFSSDIVNILTESYGEDIDLDYLK